MLFHIIEGAQVVLSCKGTYYQKKVYRRGDRLFAAWGGGFIRLGPKLGAYYGTSAPNVSWEELDMPQDVRYQIDRIKGPMV